MRGIWRIVVALLVGFTLVACSSSKSAEKSEASTEEATAKQNDEEAAASSSASDDGAKGGADKADDSKSYHDRMHELHGRLVEAYAEHADSYEKHAKEAESEKIRKSFEQLSAFHEREMKMYRGKKGGKKEAGENKKRGRRGSGRKSPPPKRVAAMGEKMHDVADKHALIAKWAGETEKDESVVDHHTMMAEKYVELAEMHEEFASRLRDESKSSEASSSGDES